MDRTSNWFSEEGRRACCSGLGARAWLHVSPPGNATSSRGIKVSGWDLGWLHDLRQAAGLTFCASDFLKSRMLGSAGEAECSREDQQEVLGCRKASCHISSPHASGTPWAAGCFPIQAAEELLPPLAVGLQHISWLR